MPGDFTVDRTTGADAGEGGRGDDCGAGGLKKTTHFCLDIFLILFRNTVSLIQCSINPVVVKFVEPNAPF